MSTIQQGPEGHETAVLLNLARPLAGPNGFGDGCGDGRLAWRHTGEIAHITAIFKQGFHKVARQIREACHCETVPAELAMLFPWLGLPSTAKQSLYTRLGDCFARKERSLAMTIPFL